MMNALTTLALLACPISMGLMMWFMMRGNGHPRPVDERARRDRGTREPRIEILTVPDCPNAEAAATRVRRALAELGRGGAPVVTRVIADEAEAERTAFTGSPTILIDGRDPFAEPGRPTGLACRPRAASPVSRTSMRYDGPWLAPTCDR